MISQCQSKHSCKVSGCNKRHRTLLDTETTKNSVTLTKNANTQTLNTGNARRNMESLPPDTANLGTPGASVNN